MVIGLSPYEFLLEKVQRKEIDPEDVDINELIEEFKQQVERLSSVELFFQAGSFLQAMARLLKLKTERLLGASPKEEKRKPKIKLEEVLKVIEQEQDQEDILDSLWDYSVGLGRKIGSRDSIQRVSTKPEPIPLHKAFNPEDYRKLLEDLGLLEDFERLKEFLLSIEDRIERLRFFMAWL
ncbi:MAG: segregation/condensation protein A [Candidatus Hadarchaeales archaeon]